MFDISKADQIFDCLVKDKQIKLPEGHKILLADEIKAKKYCKWHHSWIHTTNNCTVFKNSIQRALKEGRLELEGIWCQSLFLRKKRKEATTLDRKGN